MEKKKMKENIIIRLERENEYHEVENLVRESFWNVYRPGCLEYYVLHQLRNDPAFVPKLDFVMTLDGQLIGQNMFMKAVIAADDGRSIPIMTMGPICIAPELKRKEDASFFLCEELMPGYLNGITGEYAPPAGYLVNEKEAEAFDRAFPYMEKKKLPGQIF